MKRASGVAVLAFLVACSSDESNSNPTKHTASTTIPKDGGTIPATQDAGAETDSGKPLLDAGNNSGGEDASSGFVYKQYDVNHIQITGQSNSTANSTVPISLTQPYNNLSFNVGVMPAYTCSGEGCKDYEIPTSFIPLVEGDTFFTGGRVETASAGFANEASKLIPGHTSLVSLHGRSGNTYWCLRKGGCNYKVGLLSPFAQAAQEIKDAKTIAENGGKSYIVRAVLSIHGESDHYSYTSGSQEFPLDGSDGTVKKLKDYSDALLEWQADYESMAKGITGQSDRVPLLVSQVSGWNDTKESRLAQMQLDAHKRSNGMVVLVAPGYPFEFQSDCLHYTSDSQRRLGGYFAKVYKHIVVDGKRWEPVHPQQISSKGNSLVIDYYVPVPPLVLDTSRLTNPGNYGFEFSDTAGHQIVSVALTGPSQISIELSGPPGAGAVLRYAQNQIPKTCTGQYGARGNVRDSDTTVSEYGYEMYNYGVHFTLPLQ